MVDEVERYKRVTFMMTYFADRMRDTFKLFVQLTIAITGGFVWLKLQPGSEKAAHVLQVARWMVPFLALYMSLQMWWDDKAWRGYRRAESEFFPQLPPPRTRMAGQELIMILGMWTAAVFCFFYLR